MKRLIVLAFVLMVFMPGAANAAYEKSGVIRYPTDGDNLLALHTAAAARYAADGTRTHYKLLYTGSGASTAYVISSGVTFEDYETLEFENGAMLVPASGVTIRPYAPEHCDALPTQQIYDISSGGVIKYQKPGVIYPELWGVDGTADQIEINQAIASVNGTNVKLAGQYTINDSIELVGDSGALSADSWAVSITLADSLASGIYAITNADTTAGNDNWVISGFSIDCNRSGSPASNVGIYLINSDNNQIRNMNISSPSNHCVALEGADKNWVESCRLTDFESFGVVAIRGSNHNFILDNYLETAESGSNAIAIDDYSTSGDSFDSAFNIVMGNNIVGSNDAIVVEGCTQNIILGNIVRSPLRYGIITAVGNAGDNNRTSLDAQYNLFQDNKIYASGDNSVRILGDYNAVDNNMIFDAGNHGILGESAPILLSITNNKFFGYSGNAIRIEGGQQFQAFGNYILGISPYGDEGIYITSSDGTMQNSTISDNQLHNIGKEGIKIVKGANSLRNIDISNNKFTDVSLSSGSSYYCIEIEGEVSEISAKNNWWRGGGNALGLLNYADSDALSTNGIGNSAGSQDWDFGPFGIQVADAKSGTLTGASDKIEINVPSGSLILGVSLNNEEAVTDSAGDDTYTAAFSGGLAVSINGGSAIAAAQNTKTSEMFPQSVSMLTSSEVDITLTPNGSNFSSGNVRAIVWYMTPPNDLPDAI